MNELINIKNKIKKYTNMLFYAKLFKSEAQGNTNRFKKPTGKLKNSVKIGGNENRSFVETNLPYGRIQDKGGRITPKSKQYLKIPLHEGSKSEDLFVLKKQEKLFLVDKASFRFEYILKKEVILKPTHWWSDAVKYVENYIRNIKI